MPIYEYRCLKCNHHFDHLLLKSEKANYVAQCPKCGCGCAQLMTFPGMIKVK